MPLRRLTSARPVVSHITRLSATATFAYLIALLVPAGTARPVLAPLTALLVLQASLYQTMRSAVRKVASVTAGVLVAVGVAEFIGFSWWQLGLVIAGALVLGRALRLGDDLLEVPISAMLIFASAGSHTAATGRVVDTLVGTAAGLAGGLVFGAPKVQPAREAVAALAGRLAGLLSQMAADLAGAGPGDGPDPDGVAGWLTQARTLRDEIERVDDTLRQAADSVRLNPRSRLRGRSGPGRNGPGRNGPGRNGPGRNGPGQQPAPGDLAVTEVTLRGGLETLEHATVTVRGLARSILDSTGIDSNRAPVRDEQTRARLADVLGKLAEAIRTYGRLVQLYPAESESLRAELAGQLAAAHRQQDELAAVLEPRVPADGGSSEWPLRGEILTHVDRLRTGLRPEAVPAPGLPGPARPRPRARFPHRTRSGRPPLANRGRAHRKEARERAQRDGVPPGRRGRNRRQPDRALISAHRAR